MYRRFGPAINRRARSMLRDDEEALDVTQDTFLDFMRGAASLRGQASAFTVLYQIATHKAVDRLRKSSRWSGVLGSLEVQEESPEPSAAWTTSHQGGLPRVEALRDLAILTEGEAPEVLTAAVLYFVEGYTLDEVAQTLDLSRKTLSTLLRQFADRARQRSLRLGRGGKR
ncbi:MAG TPA: sigma-70 family RNA polymerase sigma factor [Myxococcaceae bacterium]|nr:sigma-70 family RNA polymerase sigma factor [Myxococcaceae bacterium]